MKIKDLLAKAIIITFVGGGALVAFALMLPFLIFFGIPLVALIWALDRQYNLGSKLSGLGKRPVVPEAPRSFPPNRGNNPRRN